MKADMPKAPSKAQMRKDEARWQAESMARSAMEASPAYKQLVKDATKKLTELRAEAEKRMRAR